MHMHGADDGRQHPLGEKCSTPGRRWRDGMRAADGIEKHARASVDRAKTALS
jgi:hypothetical protein